MCVCIQLYIYSIAVNQSKYIIYTYTTYIVLPNGLPDGQSGGLRRTHGRINRSIYSSFVFQTENRDEQVILMISGLIFNGARFSLS